MKSQKFNPQPTTHNSQPHRGFTLIELLVVTTLIGLIGVIITEVFVLGFRSQGKSETVKEVKQNGDYALSVIEGMVRNAADIPASQCDTGPNPDTSQLTIVNLDRFTTTFECDASSHLASISAGFPEPTPAISMPLTSSRVAVTNCTFTVVCPPHPLSPKYVYVNFTVSQAGAGLQPEKRASLEYQTTVSLRGYE